MTACNGCLSRRRARPATAEAGAVSQASGLLRVRGPAAAPGGQGQGQGQGQSGARSGSGSRRRSDHTRYHHRLQGLQARQEDRGGLHRQRQH